MHVLSMRLLTARAPTLLARCGAAPTSSSLQPGDPFSLAALCGGRHMRAGRAHATRPSPRPRPSAKPQARGSAPLRSSWPAAPQALGVASTLTWSGASDSSPSAPGRLNAQRFFFAHDEPRTRRVRRPCVPSPLGGHALSATHHARAARSSWLGEDSVCGRKKPRAGGDNRAVAIRFLTSAAEHGNTLV